MAKKTSTSGIDRRGEWVAVLGFVICLIGCLVLGTLGAWAQGTSSSVWGLAFQMFAAIGIWVLCYIELHQQRLLAEERLEVAELERQRQDKLGGVETIFDEEDLDQMEAFSMGRRLRSIQKVLLPVIAMGVAVFQLVAGLSLFEWAWQFPPLRDAPGEIANPTILLFFSGAIAFVTFMIARYALGMSRIREWNALRAGGNFTFGLSVSSLAISLALLCEIGGLLGTEAFIGKAIGWFLILLALETVANFVLDFYRPRVAGQPHRPFYDSRLLGMFSEPGGILRKFALAIDYQFGFKVSETWFYRLLGKAVLPLFIIQILVIFALTCIVVVPPGYQAVIERNGVVRSETAKPGIHVMLPWPFDRATVVPVERIQRMVLGHGEDRVGADDHESEVLMEDRAPILWTKQHYGTEYKLLVADRSASEETKVPVNLLSVSMPVQWRVKPKDDQVILYHSQSADVAGILESLADRELTRYAASHDIEDFLGAGGIDAASELQESIQNAADAAGYSGRGLGVEIVYVGIGGVHPPFDEQVAKSYEDVVSEIEKKDAAIMAARGDAAILRVASGGINWRELHDAIVKEDETAKSGRGAETREATQEVERLLREVAGGRARQLTARAEQNSYSRLFGEKSAAERYEQQLAAYNAGPKTYLLRAYLRIMTEGLVGVRKYVIAVRDSNRVHYEIDLKPPLAIDTLGAQMSALQQQSQP